MNCEDCVHWKPYTVTSLDREARRFRNRHAMGCDIFKTPATCGAHEVQRVASWCITCQAWDGERCAHGLELPRAGSCLLYRERKCA